MRALVVQHIAVEGPGTLATYLFQRGWEIQDVALYAGASLPAEPRAYDAIIVMGGPMGVYDEAQYPFLRHEQDFLQRALAQQVPLLGICLGSQLLAKALGARVYRNPQKEIGWYQVALTDAGQSDVLFAGLNAAVTVFQWHGDAFDMPAGATWLGSSALCAHQAFRYGDRVYGLLFHLELTEAVIHCWLDTFADELRDLRGHIEASHILTELPRYIEPYQALAQRVFHNLVTQVWEPLARQR